LKSRTEIPLLFKRPTSCSGGAFFDLVPDAAVDPIPHETSDDFPKSRVIQEAHDLIAIAVHAANDQLFQFAIEYVGEIVDGSVRDVRS